MNSTEWTVDALEDIVLRSCPQNCALSKISEGLIVRAHDGRGPEPEFQGAEVFQNRSPQGRVQPLDLRRP